MSITIDESTFRVVFKRLTDGRMPTPLEVAAIVQLAEVVAGADLEHDPTENSVLESLIEHLSDLAGVPVASVPRLAKLPVDSEERRPLCTRLASRLPTPDMRDLAFAFAYLVLVADLEVSPIEVEALEDVEDALEIDDRRANHLALTMARLVTPGVEERAMSQAP